MKFLVGVAGGIIGAAFAATGFLLWVTYQVDGDQFGVALFTLGYGIFALVAGFVAGTVAAVKLLAKLRTAEPGVKVGRLLACYASIPITLTLGMSEIMNHAWQEPAPMDLISAFHRNRASLDKLVSMVQADPTLSSITDDNVNPWSFNADGGRVEEYRNVLHEIGSHKGIFIEGDEIDIPGWMQGCAACSDYEKGYAYCKKPPKDQVPDIDVAAKNDKTMHFVYYQHLEGKWYLYVQYTD